MGRNIDESKAKKVITHTAKEEFKYRTSRDVSGELLFEPRNELDHVPTTHSLLHLKYTFECADDETKQTKDQFRIRHMREGQSHYRESMALPTFREHMMIQLADYVPPWFGVGWYLLFSFLSLHVLYMYYLDYFVAEEVFMISKRVSSKGDLHNEEADRTYEHRNPRIITRKEVVYFHFEGPPTFVPTSRFSLPYNPRPAVTTTVAIADPSMLNPLEKQPEVADPSSIKLKPAEKPN